MTEWKDEEDSSLLLAVPPPSAVLSRSTPDAFVIVAVAEPPSQTITTAPFSPITFGARRSISVLVSPQTREEPQYQVPLTALLTPPLRAVRRDVNGDAVDNLMHEFESILHMLKASDGVPDPEQKPPEAQADTHQPISSAPVKPRKGIFGVDIVENGDETDSCNRRLQTVSQVVTHVPRISLTSNSILKSVPSLTPSLLHQSLLLTDEHLLLLRPFLPLSIRHSDWSLIFDTASCGFSLQALIRAVRGAGPLVTVLRDDSNCIFGAFLSHEWQISQSAFYGNGECFLFTLEPKSAVFEWHGDPSMAYFIHGTLSDGVAVGGGNGKRGLWLDDNLYHGHTESCPTFNNEPLSIKNDFSVMHLEVWNFVR